jgi:hypothetical protein
VLKKLKKISKINFLQGNGLAWRQHWLNCMGVCSGLAAMAACKQWLIFSYMLLVAWLGLCSAALL